MNYCSNKLHVLVDSRESSISGAMLYFQEQGQPELALVEHIRVTSFPQRFAVLLANCGAQDELLIAVQYLPPEQLELAALQLESCDNRPGQITMLSYDCFSHLELWCKKHDIIFRHNPLQGRELSNESCHEIEEYLTGQRETISGPQKFSLERIWIQYRLILAIIARLELLGEIIRQLILGQPGPGNSKEGEYARGLRYFSLGEPDMAGGSYSCEQEQQNGIDLLRERVNLIAATDYHVLLSGDSGTGKEALAWVIHEFSTRRDQPFLAINCAGLSDQLLESEMFGYLKGSHNQAYEEHLGFLERVDGGTLFLDELPEMSPRIQAKLLRFLENGEYRPLGAAENRYATVRIIAAGQPELLADPQRVRVDLKSRIGQLDAHAPALQELEEMQAGTILKIAFILLERYTWTTTFRQQQRVTVSPADIQQYQQKLGSQYGELIARFPWADSNVRELNNFLRRWLVIGDGEFRQLQQKGGSGPDSRPANRPEPELFDNKLAEYLQVPTSRAGLKELLAQKPLANIKKAYVRHLFAAYANIVVQENEDRDMPRRPTQKELALLMQVTENTLSRYRS